MKVFFEAEEGLWNSEQVRQIQIGVKVWIPIFNAIIKPFPAHFPHSQVNK